VSDRHLRALSAALALAGLAIAAYLTYTRYSGARIACATGGCETVQQSAYATVAGIPVAVLGLAGYLAILGTALVRGLAGAAAAAALSAGGLLFSLFLLYAQLFEIGAVCQWCLAQDGVMAVLVAVSTRRLHCALREDPGIYGTASRITADMRRDPTS
jgi:uncharacterized membrane protein